MSERASGDHTITRLEGTRPWQVALCPLGLVFFVLLRWPLEARAQALPFHTATAITAGFNENAGRHLLSVQGRSRLLRDGMAVTDPMDREIDAVAVVSGVVLGAFTPLWTVTAVAPWVRKEMQFTSTSGTRARYTTSGFGDALLRTKWVFYRNDRPGATTRLAILGEFKLPTGRTDARLWMLSLGVFADFFAGIFST